jgi:hypothetical protein
VPPTTAAVGEPDGDASAEAARPVPWAAEDPPGVDTVPAPAPPFRVRVPGREGIIVEAPPGSGVCDTREVIRVKQTRVPAIRAPEMPPPKRYG